MGPPWKAPPESSPGDGGSQALAGPSSLLATLDALHDGAAILDERCHVLYANPALRRVLGLVEGKKWPGCPSKESARCAACQHAAALDGKPVRWEMKSPGCGRVFDVVETSIETAGGRRERLAIFRDVTDLKAAQGALRAAEGFSRTVFSSIGEGVIVYDRELRYRLWNRFMESLTGMAARSVLGKKAVDLFPHLREQGIDLLLRRALSGETVVSQDTPYWIPGTDRRGWAVSLFGPHLDQGGKIIGVVGIVRDITGRKETERALREQEVLFRSTFDQSPLGAAMVALDHRFERINDVFCGMAGSSREDLLERRLEGVFDDRDVPAMTESLDLLAAGEIENRQGEMRVTRGSGEPLWVNLSVRLIRDSDGRPTRFLVLAEDIAERKAAVDALRRSERELSLRNRISEIFLAVPDAEMYGKVLDVILDAMESAQGSLGYIDEAGALVCPYFARGIWDGCETPGKSTVLPRETWDGLWGQALLERRPVWANGGIRLQAGHIPIERALCVPLIHGEELVGLIAVARKPTDYGEPDVRHLESLAAHVAPILHARLERDRQREARARAEDALGQLRKMVVHGTSFAGIVGQDPKMLDLFEALREVAAVDIPVLIQGESGTGKELAAAAIHSQGPRAGKPFVPVNCSAIPESLLESELFGHVRGAFTGAIRSKKGRFELADGGTIFLDEVGDLGLPVQVSLLRVLQEGTIDVLGGEGVRKVDVRVISATHKDLQRLIAEGKFREDLYYRLCVVPIHVPPLRNRLDDIPLLVRHILDSLPLRGDGSPLEISEEVLEALRRHSWPGNVRELQNAIHYASVKCRGKRLEIWHLPSLFSAGPALDRPRPGRPPKLTADEVRRALAEARGNRVAAARALKVTRSTLYRYLGLEGKTR